MVIGGRYEVARLLGKGGMGEVYEATDQQTQRRVAVKLLSDEPARRDPEVQRRFAREIMLTAKVSSRHVVAVHDAGFDDATERPFMVMDYLDGEDLGSIAERLGTLPVELSLRLVAQACEGLAEAHAAGIVHRDIKPSNLFLVAPTAAGGRIVKILDFGIARVRGIDGEMAPTELTQTGAILGSPLYMAPEQLRGARELDHRADVWSLGVVLYRLLTGSVPHQGATFADLLIKVCSDPAPPIRTVAPWVPAEVATVVHGALQIEVDARTSSVRALADALRPLLREGTTITDAMLVAQPRTATASKAPPRRALVVALAATAGLAAAGIAYRSTREPDDEPAPHVPPYELHVRIPDKLRASVGDVWWQHAKSGCTRDHLAETLRTAPPDEPKVRPFMIACAALAGDVERARHELEAIPRNSWSWGIMIVPPYVNAMFDQRVDDPAVLPLVELSLESWPDNANLLYIAGIAELEAGQQADAREHLGKFVDNFPNDLRVAAARAILDVATAPADCRTVVDHHGRKIPRWGC